MFKQRSRFYQHAQLAGDVLLTVLSVPLAYYTRRLLPAHLPYSTSELFNPELRPLEHYLLLLGIILPVWTAVLYFHGARSLLPTESLRAYGWNLMQLEVMGVFLLGFFSFFFQLNLSRSLLLLFLLWNITLLFLFRCLFVWFIRNRSYRDHELRRIVIVGTGATAQRIGRLIEKYRFYGITLGGYLNPPGDGKRNSGPCLSRELGSLDDLPELVRREVIDEIIFVGGSDTDWNLYHDSFRFCEELGLPVRLVADIFPRSISRVTVDHLEQIPLVSFTSTPDPGWSLLLKRILDVILGVLFLLASLPLMLVVAVLIKLSSPGPILYRQIRCGLYGRRFMLYKFRSMFEGAEDVLWEIRHLNEMSGPVFKMRNDPRVTRLGRILRKTSMDELPQFWNVIRGEMSLVGPRAPLPEEVAAYTNGQRRRLSVKPGITCLWQVSGRNHIDFDQWMQLDLQYIDQWCLWLDVKILLRTIPIVLFCRGAH